MINAKIKRGTSGIVFINTFEKNADVNAPTHINPACPSDNSPRYPTQRLSPTATSEKAHTGTISPPIRELRLPVASMIVTTKYKTMIIPIVVSNFCVDLLRFFIAATYTFSFVCLPRIPVGLTSNTIISTANTIASAS